MARHVTFEDSWIRFVPEIGLSGNREDPEPVAMEIHPISAGEMRALGRRVATKLGREPEVVVARRLVEQLLTDRVRAIVNYSVNGGAITTGAELGKNGESEVIDEVVEALTAASVLDDDVKKKSP